MICDTSLFKCENCSRNP